MFNRKQTIRTLVLHQSIDKKTKWWGQLVRTKKRMPALLSPDKLSIRKSKQKRGPPKLLSRIQMIPRNVKIWTLARQELSRQLVGVFNWRKRIRSRDFYFSIDGARSSRSKAAFNRTRVNELCGKGGCGEALQGQKDIVPGLSHRNDHERDFVEREIEPRCGSQDHVDLIGPL